MRAILSIEIFRSDRLIKTGDELELLADQFNQMADQLQASYADLEKKVELRTRELAQSVEELRALGEVSQAVNSTLDLETVLNTIVAKARNSPVPRPAPSTSMTMRRMSSRCALPTA
jgi:nitrate/nitrite-specific signal transduction histidine kinase